MRARRFDRASAWLSGTALSETIAVAVHLEDVDVVGKLRRATQVKGASPPEIFVLMFVPSSSTRTKHSLNHTFKFEP